MHYGLTTVQIRKLAYEYAKSLNLKYPVKWDENKMAGLEWMRKYRKRNSNLSLRKPENTSTARSFAFNKTAITEFYNNLTEVMQRHNFTADRIFNFDETGVSTVLDTPKVLAPKSQKQVGQIVSSERGELVTFGAIISASGNHIPPLFVFPRVHYKDHFLEGAPYGSIGAANRSGWINAEIFVTVLKHIQKHTLSSKEHPILLLCDNHESHISLQAITYARDNGITFVSFPPHTSHRLQPLDVGVFGPFKAKLKIAFNNWHLANPGKTISIYNIPKLVKLAYMESFNFKNIISGFAKPGIWPFNQMAFSDEDFAPVSVYTSSNLENIPPNSETNSAALGPQPSINLPSPNINVEDLLLENNTIIDESIDTRELSSPSLLQDLQDIFTEICKTSTSSAVTTTINIPITPDVIRPYPTIVRKRKSNKGRKPGKSRIYTNTPEKNELEERHKQKEIKKKEQERRARTKGVKRSLLSRPKKKKVKIMESNENSEESDKSQISLRESSFSPLDLDEDDHEDDFNKKFDATPKNIKDNSFILVKFPKKTCIIYYVGKVLCHYSPKELKVSYLRKKPGSWSFVFPDVEDIHTVYFSDIAKILPDPQPQSNSTARMSRIFTFPVNLKKFNVQ
ncbi:unnamed protein product [Euphydryas editha]|uniref:DDE-1 domain-containing protein n=1 Tax=Euphydryas editha TaxID=104508 RepID=A0AAU9TF40_EUPED|nr:unnamed protein product [Euphydryas editha]